MPTYADWKAPKTDARHLIWPSVDQILSEARDERIASAARTVMIQNLPLAELRRRTRAYAGHPQDALLIATGHQVELYHPGVWAKNVLLHTLQTRDSGVRGLHIAVDTDSPKHLQLRWPGGAVDLSDDVRLRTGEWSGQVRQPSAAHLRKVQSRFTEAMTQWPFAPSIQPFFDSLNASQSTHLMLPQAVLNAAAAVDKDLGLKHDATLLSPLLDGDGYLALVHHIASDVERFANVYNTALADYRTEAGIDSSTRPMPDLRVTDDSIELPFWLDRLDTGDRARATVVRNDTDNLWYLLGDDAAFAFDPAKNGDTASDALRAFCKKQSIRLTPRALTLTMFFRLLLVDQFVHGIGGGRYDQITDRIIQNYFHTPAPAFAVTTATLFFPGDQQRSSADCVSCLLAEGHRLKHSLVDKKVQLAAIAEAPRLSTVRKTAYLSLHHEIAQAAAQGTRLASWRERLQQTLTQQEHERTLFDRELFYAIQPRERLLAMIDAYATSDS